VRGSNLASEWKARNLFKQRGIDMWWTFPLGITIGAFSMAWYLTRDSSGFAKGLDSLLGYGAASIVSLVAWLAWALLK
jgi:hypothetical protein